MEGSLIRLHRLSDGTTWPRRKFEVFLCLIDFWKEVAFILVEVMPSSVKFNNDDGFRLIEKEEEDNLSI